MSLLTDWINGDAWNVIQDKFNAIITVVNTTGSGTTGQVLKKTSNSDFDYAWADEIDAAALEAAVLVVNGGLAKAIVDIGPWDMNNNLTRTITVTHGLALADIRSVQVMISNDAGTLFSPLNSWDSGDTGIVNGGIENIDSTDITLTTSGTGDFDNTDYNDGVMNRGYIVIEYLA